MQLTDHTLFDEALGRQNVRRVAELEVDSSKKPLTVAEVKNAARLVQILAHRLLDENTPPGSAEAEVSSVEAASNLVVDARAENEGNGWVGSGANPWHLDNDTDSVLFLTNMGDQPARIGFEVTANSVHYYLAQLKLNPHETRAIDIRALRDAQFADFEGNKIPATATDGSVNWIRLDDAPVMGRSMVINRHGGLASSYDCNFCPCPPPLYAMYMTSPSGCALLPAQTIQCQCYAYYRTCNENSCPALATGAATWTTGNAAVVTVDSSVKGEVHAVGNGAAGITATLSGQTSKQVGPPPGRCVFSPITKTAQMQMNVDSLVFTITSGGAPNDSQGAVSGTPFNLQMQAKSASTGAVPDTTFNDQNVQFNLMSINTSIGESAPSSVSFSSGTANASVTIVQASGLTNSARTIVVSANATGTVFYPYVYMDVTATDEGHVGQPTACGYTIPANAQMVALPYSSALCGQQVLVANGSKQQQAPVEDVGPWCPHSAASPGNPCVCPSDDYWDNTGIPYAATHSCSSNGAGIDLGDGTYSTVRGGTNGPVDWKFP